MLKQAQSGMKSFQVAKKFYIKYWGG